MSKRRAPASCELQSRPEPGGGRQQPLGGAPPAAGPAGHAAGLLLLAPCTFGSLCLVPPLWCGLQGLLHALSGSDGPPRWGGNGGWGGSGGPGDLCE